MSFQFIWIFMLLSSCSGTEYFVINLQNSSTNHTCYRQDQQFQPCNTLEHYSRMFHNQSDINVTLYLLDDTYEISADVYFYFTNLLVDIRPWNNDSIATINCTSNNIGIQISGVEILKIQSVQFLHCGRPGHAAVILLSRSFKTLNLALMLNLNFTQSRSTSIKICSDIIELDIVNCVFTKGIGTVLSFHSNMITRARIRSTSFTNNSVESLLFYSSFIKKSNLVIQDCTFENNTSSGFLSNILLSSLSSVVIRNSNFVENSPNGAAIIRNINLVTITACSFQNNEAKQAGALSINGVSKIYIEKSVFTENKVIGSGGSILISGVSNHTHFSNCSFSKNTAKYGGAIFCDFSDILYFSDCEFISNTAEDRGGAVYSSQNVHNQTNCLFSNNSAGNHGGALFLRLCYTLNISECRFVDNAADGQGGAVYDSMFNYGIKVRIYQSHFINNKATSYSGGLKIRAKTIEIMYCTWINNSAYNGGGAMEITGKLHMTSCAFFNNKAGFGGSLRISSGPTVFIEKSNFSQNIANTGGGAIYVTKANKLVILDKCNFVQNIASMEDGGALLSYGDTLKVNQTIFVGNFARNGGAIEAARGQVEIYNATFNKNHACSSGGAIVASTTVYFILKHSELYSNVANNGGGLELTDTDIAIVQSCKFIQNIAGQNNMSKMEFIAAGGAAKIMSTNAYIINTQFTNNEASHGGAILIDDILKVIFAGCFFHFNKGAIRGGAVSIANQSTVSLFRSSFFNNSAHVGGAISLEFIFEPKTNMTCAYNSHENISTTYIQTCLDSCHRLVNLSECLSYKLNNLDLLNHYNIMFINCSFSNNAVNHTVGKGGGISIKGVYREENPSSGHIGRCYPVTILKCNHQGNKAIQGGGIYSNFSSMVIEDTMFKENIAEITGGGIYMAKSKLYLDKLINFSENEVLSHVGKGGGIHVQSNVEDRGVNGCPILWGSESLLNFTGNVAPLGQMVYGGMLDRCSYLPGSSLLSAIKNVFTAKSNYDLHSYGFTSRKVRICFCSSCELRTENVSIYPGQGYSVSLACVDQLEQPLNNCVVSSEYYSSLDVELGQGEHKVTLTGCQMQTFHALSLRTGFATLNITSTILCTDFNWSGLVVHFNIESCPIGFQLYNKECRCDKRLFNIFKDLVCDINKELLIMRHSEWFSYQGYYLRTHTNCPLNYCYKGTRSISPKDPDSQCAYNRGGILCGRCVVNFSVVLGSWKCMDCSNLSRYNFIWLTILLALAGVVLVVFLFVVKMTVSSGTTNGLIFYANIMSFSGLLDFRTCSIHPILRIFMSWINMDLGIEVCYYSGMDVYQKTWLQFVFPFYIWFLVGVIILFCHYSSRVMKLMGMRNIEVLATLFLLSYAKLLKTIVTTFSFTDIMVAQAENVSDALLPSSVWVYDGSIKYLGGKHVPLFFVALLLLLLLFLPYTLLLTFGQYLHFIPNKKYLKFIRSTLVTTVLDAYHAPYNRKFRYWTGLCLLIRGILFTIFAVSHTIETNIFWTSIAIIFLFSVRMLSGKRIYKKRLVDIQELLILLNLLALMVASSRSHFCSALTVSVTLSAIIFGFIFIFHIWQELRKNCSYRNLLNGIIKRIKKVKSDVPDIQGSDTVNIGKPSVSYVELRESLIEP